MSINIETAAIADPVATTYRDFKSITSEELRSHLSKCDWSVMNDQAHGVNTRLDILSRNLTGALDELAPEKHFIPRKKCDLPWIDDELRHIYKKQEAVKRRHHRTKSNDLWIEYQSITKIAE